MADILPDECNADDEHANSEETKNKGGRPAKDTFDKQDKLYRVYLDMGENAVANDMLMFYKIKDMPNLFRFLLREDAVRNREAIDKMLKDSLLEVSTVECKA